MEKTAPYINEAQKACIELIKTLELSRKDKDKDKVYYAIRDNLQYVYKSTDNVLMELIKEGQ